MWNSGSKHPSRPANPEAESESLCNQMGSTVEDVDLGAAGVVVVEVAPGEHVDLADATSDDVGDEGLDLGADVLTFRRHGGATYRAG